MSANHKSGTVRFTVQPKREDALTIQSNLNQFQSSFENQLFTHATQKVTDIGHYVYSVYFLNYFRAAFFLCLVPFWVDITDQMNVKLVTYKFQRVLCAIVHIFSFLSWTLWFRLNTIESIKERPDKVCGMTRNL